MTMTDTVLHLDPTTILPDPNNPRETLRDMGPFTESIRIVGVREPITIRYLEDGRPMAVKGHRRLFGAVDAKCPTIPCILENEDDANDPLMLAFLRLTENVQRDDFNVAEEARAVQQCLDLGADEATIATKLAIDPQRVAEAKTVAASPVAIAVSDKHNLGFDEALALAEFEDDTNAVKLLTVTAIDKPDDWDHVLSRLRQDRDEATAIATEAKKWTDKGYKILEQSPSPGDQTASILDYLSTKAGATRNLTVKQHEKCPGRSVTIRVIRNGEVRVNHYCTDWKANGHFHDLHSPTRGSSTSTSSSPGQPRATEKTPQQKAEDSRHRDAMKAGRAAQTVRRQFVRDLLQRKSAPGTDMLAVATLGIMGHHLDEREKMFRDLAGMEPSASAFSYNAVSAQTEFLAKVGTRYAVALFARLAAHVEYHWETNSWNMGKGQARDLRTAYLRFLIKVGYKPSVVERVFLGDAKPTEITKEADALKAAK